MPLANQASSPSRLFAEVTTGRLLRETALRREARDRSVSAKRDARVTVGAANASVVILFLREPRVLLRVLRVDAAVCVSRVVAFHVRFSDDETREIAASSRRQVGKNWREPRSDAPRDTTC